MGKSFLILNAQYLILLYEMLHKRSVQCPMPNAQFPIPNSQ
ncbi:MAG: hypothetical protein V7K98_14565 [Nostoc sp.]